MYQMFLNLLQPLIYFIRKLNCVELFKNPLKIDWIKFLYCIQSSFSNSLITKIFQKFDHDLNLNYIFLL
jgi:hypothetical protein